MKYQLLSLILLPLAAGAQAATSSDAIKLPAVIVCQHGAEDLKLYTRLEALHSAAQIQGTVTLVDGGEELVSHADETAKQDNDYLASRIENGQFNYFSYSCDTTDYTYTIAMSDLVEAANSPVQSKIVRMHYNENTRGEDDEDKDLDCRAEY